MSFDDRVVIEGGFDSVSRSSFRAEFQPSRIVIALLPDATHGANPVTLCFVTHAAYRPRMVAFSIQQGSRSYGLLLPGIECVLAVPGEGLVEETMYFGVRSGNQEDKLEVANAKLLRSNSVSVPGLALAIANIEVTVEAVVPAGDHKLAIGRVSDYRVRSGHNELPLLSIGPRTAGYKVLAKRGMHRLGVVRAILSDSKRT